MPSPAAPTRWQRAGHLGLVAVLALGFALTLGIFVEANYARPYCTAYGASRQLTYGGLAYPSAPIGLSGRQPPTCLFVKADRSLASVPYAEVAPSRAIAVMVDLATTPLLTVPVLFGVLAAGLFAIYGALGMTGSAGDRSAGG